MTDTTEARRLARELESIFVSEDVSAVKSRAIAAMLRALADENERMRAQVEALRADAERYRWLRSRIPGGTYRIMGVIYSEGGDGVDAAIDAARSQEAAR